jgi:hypothetical protein
MELQLYLTDVEFLWMRGLPGVFSGFIRRTNSIHLTTPLGASIIGSPLSFKGPQTGRGSLILTRPFRNRY